MRHTLILLMVILMRSSGCDNTTESTLDSFTYPLTIGNTWKYERQFKTVHVSPDSLKGQLDFADTSVVDVAITQTVDLAGNDNTIEMMGLETADHGTFRGYYYYVENSDGLFQTGYSGGGPVVMPKHKAIKEIRLAGLSFSSLSELLNALTKGAVLIHAKQDSVYLENPPVKALGYPLNEGKSWTYRSMPWRMDKEITGNETIETDAGSFQCFKIRWLYDMDENGSWDENISIIDHISEEGLVKRTMGISDITYTNENGEVIGVMDYLEEFTLLEYGLK